MAKESKEKESWGYSLYPERRGTFKPTTAGIFTTFQGREVTDKYNCEKRVYEAFQSSPIVKILLGALKRSGCPVDIRRHVTCEVCDPTVTGGYDPELNQIVVCQNMCRNIGMVQSVLSHELIHMFDYCTNELNFKNMEHLACTEIRAANLTHCSYTSACSQGDASLFKIAKTHQECVKTKALYSVLAVRQIGKEEAIKVINKVFPKCYADLEPIGRRVRRNSGDQIRAFREGPLYGYDL